MARLTLCARRPVRGRLAILLTPRRPGSIAVVRTGDEHVVACANTGQCQFDLEGVWDFSTITPLERPNGLGDKQTFTDEEAATFEREENQRQNRDLIDPKKAEGSTCRGSVIPYNEFWYERGNKILGDKRTSLIVDPPDGRIPRLTPEAQQRLDALAAIAREEQLGHVRADSPESRSLADRCILGFNAGPPMTPGAYNNNVQIFAGTGDVGRPRDRDGARRAAHPAGRPASPPVSQLRQWMGDSRGRWEGRHAGHRHHELSPRDELPRLERQLAPGRAADASRCRRRCSTSSRSTTRRPGRSRGPRRSR